MSAIRSTIGLIVWVSVCFGAALLGSIFTGRSVADWYVGLNKPDWTPPNWIFAPVWSLLYLMMALAAWLVWRKDGLAAAALPLRLFALQLALNVAWSAVFFGLQMPAAAFAEIVILWSLIAATVFAFWCVAPVAAVLMVPYLGWVTFAAALNLAIWRMNI